MPHQCTVCSHPRHRAIERARARGRSLRWLARQNGLSKDAIRRHMHHPPFRIPAFILPTWMTGQVRGNPEKTRPYRWKPGQSGDPHGRLSTRPRTVED
jgi:hypothetical protein